MGSVLYRKKRSSDVDELAHQSVNENSKGEPPSIENNTKPAGGPPGKEKPKNGPPGKPKPKNGPPGVSKSATSGPEGAEPSQDQVTQPEVDLQANAAAHFGALDSLIPQPAETSEISSEEITQPISTIVVDWNGLPGGGDYEYTSDATYYIGEKCGKWLLNEDKSFTRIE